MVAGRDGLRRLRGLAEFPAAEDLPEPEMVTRAAEHALRAPGVARARDIERHFTIGRYPGLTWSAPPGPGRSRSRTAASGGGPTGTLSACSLPDGALPPGSVAAALGSLAAFAGGGSVICSGATALGVS
jgi:hypothetical protein